MLTAARKAGFSRLRWAAFSLVATLFIRETYCRYVDME